MLSDLATASTLASLAALDLVCPESQLKKITQTIARLHIGIRGSKAQELSGAGTAAHLDLDWVEIEREFLAGVYREMLYTVRHFRGGSWRPEIKLHGKQHLDEALKKGNGVVVWGWACTYGGLLGKRILHDNGYRVAMLASRAHPYSGTPFGVKYLNPVRTGLENQYLIERIVIEPGSEILATRRVLELLRKNEIVEISATGTGNAVAGSPFLGGTLNLALGAPTLASMSGAELLPMACIPRNDDGFDVYIEKALRPEGEEDIREFSRQAATRFSLLASEYVERAPHVWRGWFNRANWTPGSAELNIRTQS